MLPFYDKTASAPKDLLPEEAAEALKSISKARAKLPPSQTTKAYQNAKAVYERLTKKSSAPALSDFTGAIDPRGADPLVAGITAQKARLRESDHKKKQQLAMLGGSLGGSVIVPAVVGGAIGGASGALTSKGGLKERLVGAGAGAGRAIGDLATRQAVPYALAGGYLGAITARNQYNTGRNLAIMKEASEYTPATENPNKGDAGERSVLDRLRRLNLLNGEATLPPEAL